MKKEFKKVSDKIYKELEVLKEEQEDEELLEDKIPMESVVSSNRLQAVVEEAERVFNDETIAQADFQTIKKDP